VDDFETRFGPDAFEQAENQLELLKEMLVSITGELDAFIEKRIHPRLRPLIGPEDVRQEVFKDAVACVRRFTVWDQYGNRGRLFVMASQEIVNAIREAAAQKRSGDSSDAYEYACWVAKKLGHTPSSTIRRLESAEAVHRAVAELPDDQQKAVRLRFFEGMSVKAVALALGRSANAVGKLLARAMARLSRIIDSSGAFRSRAGAKETRCSRRGRAPGFESHSCASARGRRPAFAGFPEWP